MTKYNEEFKLKLVQEYLAGPLGYKRLARKYEMSIYGQIVRWVRVFQAFGKAGLRDRQKNKVYSVQSKLNVLHFMKQTGASYQDSAIEFEMHNPTLIVKWKQTFLAERAEGLRKKGRPPMAKHPKKKPAKADRTMSREEQLERENELLRLEVAYLKKLEAFQENPNAFLEKHKQRWRSSSKKKDSD